MNDTWNSSLPSTIMPLYEGDSGSADYSDLEFDSPCDKSLVRNFRKYYEPPLYLLIVFVGFIGNLLVVWIYKTFKNRLKTMTDVYLLNLAVADLLFLCTLPFWAADAVVGWKFGSATCKGVFAFYKINFFSSMILLTCISVDRYINIVQTTKAQNSKKQRLFYSKVICVFVWLLSIMLSMPEFLFAQFKIDADGNRFCTMVYWNNENNRTKILVLSLQILMGFCVPLIVMIYCYAVIMCTLLKSRNFEKHKALRVILAVVAVFILSQLPYNTMLAVEAAQAANTTITDCNQAQGVDIVGQVMKSMAYMHSCLNPILYAFVGVRFRKDLARLFRNVCILSTSKPSKPYTSSVRSTVMSDADSSMALSL